MVVAPQWGKGSHDHLKTLITEPEPRFIMIEVNFASISVDTLSETTYHL
jgi:hypothetical protein